MCCNQVGARDAVLDLLGTVFSRHGAVPMASALVGSATLECEPDTAVLLNQAGRRLALRYDLRSSFVSWLVSLAKVAAARGAAVEPMRRYEVRILYPARARVLGHKTLEQGLVSMLVDVRNSSGLNQGWGVCEANGCQMVGAGGLGVS